MAKIEEKQPIIREIAEQLDGACSAVAVDYRGLNVEQDTRLRRTLREAGVVYKVYKNTMISFAVKGTEFEPLTQNLEGPTAIAIGKEDAAVPARILKSFAKEAPQLELKGGVVEGTYYDAAGILAIADIPGREVLISRLLGSMKSPIANLARVLSQIAENGGSSGEGEKEESAAEAEPQEAAAEKQEVTEEAAAQDEPQGTTEAQAEAEPQEAAAETAEVTAQAEAEAKPQEGGQ